MPNKDDENRTTETSAAITEISLSQALLAPLDAIFKAQIHSARSFLNLILQLGYQHKPTTADGAGTDKTDGPFKLEFIHETTVDGRRRRQKISIPALAAVPISPLTVESAEFNFSMRLSNQYYKHRQVQESRNEHTEDINRNKRPWFLVDQPISLRGNIASPEVAKAGNTSAINISVKVGPAKIPSGLNKFITSLGEFAEIQELPDEPDSKTSFTTQSDA